MSTSIQNQNFGVEIELTGITRATAAATIAEYFGKTSRHIGTSYDTYGARDRKGRTIRKVAVLGGAGGDYLHPAAAAGADALVTGEAKHHEYLEAVRMGITLLDATHYATEQVVLRPLAEYLTACCPDVRFAVGCGGDALCFTGGCRG